jgi:hypothetical protein
MNKILRNCLRGQDLHLMRDGGILVDMPKAERTSVSATPQGAQALKRLCRHHKRSESYVVERLAMWLERQPHAVRTQLLEHVDDAFALEYSQMVARSLAIPLSQQPIAPDIQSGQSPEPVPSAKPKVAKEIDMRKPPRGNRKRGNGEAG